MKQSHFIHPLLMALSLLTCLPVTRWLPDEWSDKDQGISTLWYPAVGMVLASLLFAVYLLVPSALSSLVVSTTIVVFWVLLTGALHLDGLADSTDAAYASHRIFVSDALTDKNSTDENSKTCEKVLAIFKDPNVGVMGCIALIVTLLLKVIFLAELIESSTWHLWFLLALILTVPRTLVLLLMITTPYVNPKGLGTVMIANIPKTAANIVIVAVIIASFLFLPFFTFLISFLSLGLLFFLWRGFWVKRIKGFVGDCAGALIELSEVLVLIVLCLFSVA